MNGLASYSRMRIVEPRPPHWSKTKSFAAGLLIGCLFTFFADAFIHGMHVTIETRCFK